MQAELPVHLHAVGEHLAVGFMEALPADALARMACGLRRQLEGARLPEYWRNLTSALRETVLERTEHMA